MCDKKNSVLFIDTGCFVLSPDFKLANESQVLLKVPRKNNMYSVDMKNIIPKECLTCLVAKATLDESMLWHRRLGSTNGTNCHLTRITSNPIVPPKETSQTPVITFNPEVKVYRRRTKVAKSVSFSDEPSILGSRPSNILEPNINWGYAVSNSPSSSRVQCRSSKLSSVKVRTYTYEMDSGKQSVQDRAESSFFNTLCSKTRMIGSCCSNQCAMSTLISPSVVSPVHVDVLQDLLSERKNHPKPLRSALPLPAYTFLRPASPLANHCSTQAWDFSRRQAEAESNPEEF
ncbi:hypothetical protein Tco_0238286 [Tanacetum coccineum]